MRRSIEVCGTAMFCMLAAACAQLPLPREDAGRAPATEAEAKAEADAETAAKTQDDAEESDESNLGYPLPDTSAQEGGRRENLTCFAGSEDRHARIGVELVNDQVTYFAFYSKSRPRTCSIEAGRDDSLSRWTDNGAYFTVMLRDRKGKLLIEQGDGAYRFAFVDVDRNRYCGMPGKINGSLTVTRGKKRCEVQGIMDGHSL